MSTKVILSIPSQMATVVIILIAVSGTSDAPAHGPAYQRPANPNLSPDIQIGKDKETEKR